MRASPLAPPRAQSAAPRSGSGSAFAHHGEILQGVFRTSSAPCGWVNALVTLPLHRVGARASFTACSGAESRSIRVYPPSCRKALHAAELTMRHLERTRGLRPCGGRLRITGLVPVGLGMGSSTADVLAAIRAVCDAVGVALTVQETIELGVGAEKASDPPHAADETVLFAQRSGHTLEHLGSALPAMLLVSVRTCRSRSVDTVSLAPLRGLARQLDSYQDLRCRLRAALENRDVAEIGAVATHSAQLNQARLPKPELAAIVRVCAATGGAGVQVAHSGNVASIIYPDAPSCGAEAITESTRLLGLDGIEVAEVLRVGRHHTDRKQKPDDI